MKFGTSTQSSKRKRPFVRLATLAGILLLSAGLWWGPSALVRYALDRGFAAIGYRVVDVGDVVASLIGRRIDVTRIRIDRPDGGVAELDLFGIRISPIALMSGRIDVPQARMSGLSIEIVRADDGSLRIAGLPVTAGKSGGSGALPAIVISDFELTASRIALRGNGTRADVAIQRLAVDGLRFGDPASTTGYELAGSIDGHPVKISGTVKPFAESPVGAARIEMRQLALAPLAKLVGLTLAGTLDAALDVKIDGAKPADRRISAEGSATLLAGSAYGTAADMLGWRGTLSFDANGIFAAMGVLDASRLRHADGTAKIGVGTARYEGALELQAGKAPIFDGTLAAGAVDLSAEGLDDLSVEKVRLDIARSGGQSGDAIGGRATFEIANVAAKIGAGMLRASALQGQGAASIGVRKQAFDGVVEIVSPSFEQGGGNYRAGRIATDAVRLSLNDGKGSARGVVSGEGLEAHAVAFDGAAARFRYDATVDLDAGRTAIAGRLNIESIRADLPDAAAGVSLDAAQYDGALAVGETFSADGQLGIGQIKIDDKTGRDLFAASRADLAGLNFGPAGLAATRVGISEARLLRREKAIPGREAFPWRLEAPRATMEDVRITPSGGIAVTTLRAEQPEMRITRVKSGMLSFELDAPPVPGAPAPAPSPGLSISRFEIVNGRAAFEDRTPHEIVRVPLDRLALTVTDLDDRQPGRPSSATLEGRIGSFGTAKLRGTVYPFAEHTTFDMEFSAQSIDLPPISAYADEFLGVNVRTGTASVEGRVVARDEKVNGTTKWKIANIQLDERETGTVELAEHAGAPVQTALSLLSDDDNNIELEIPIAGEFANPTFDTGDAMRRAVGGAMRGALSNTLTLLFPFGTFISAIIDDSQRGTGIALPVVTFAAGKSTLDGNVVEIVDGLAKLLSTRPAARLEVCGFANPGDLPNAPKDEAVLREIAAARGEAVKRRLVEAANVDPGRIFECRPVVETAATAMPRAELNF